MKINLNFDSSYSRGHYHINIHVKENRLLMPGYLSAGLTTYIAKIPTENISALLTTGLLLKPGISLITPLPGALFHEESNL